MNKPKRKPITPSQDLIIFFGGILYLSCIAIYKYIRHYFIRSAYSLVPVMLISIGLGFIVSPPQSTVPIDYQSQLIIHFISAIIGIMFIGYAIFRFYKVFRGDYDIAPFTVGDEGNVFDDTWNGHTLLSDILGIEPYYGDDVLDPNEEFQTVNRLEDDAHSDESQWQLWDDELKELFK